MKIYCFFSRNRIWLSPVFTIIMVGVMIAILSMPYVYKLEKYQQAVDSLKPRIERMLGLLEFQNDLQIRQQQYQQKLDLLGYSHTSESEVIQVNLSTRLRQSVEGSGLILANLTPKPIKLQEGLEQFPVVLNVSGSVLQLQTFIEGLNQGPKIWVDSLVIAASRSPKDESQVVNAEIIVSAFRRRKI